MSETKIYVPRCNAKEHVFQGGGSIIKLGFNAEALIAFVQANKNDRGYINFDVGKRKTPGQYGETHTVTLNTFKPSGETRPSSTPAPRPASPPKDRPQVGPKELNPPGEESDFVPF